MYVCVLGGVGVELVVTRRWNEPSHPEIGPKSVRKTSGEAELSKWMHLWNGLVGAAVLRSVI